MEEMAMRAHAQMQKPIKTEWNSRCVIFTYFQGDINSVVDEHFSRALRNVKVPKELSPLSQSGDVVLRNDSDMLPNQWRFSSQWTKPQPEVPFANGAANCITNGFGPMAMDKYPLPLTGSPSVQPDDLWHFSSTTNPGFPESEYPSAFSAGHLVPEAQPNGKYESFLNFLQQERCVAYPQPSTMWENCNSAQAARSMGSPFSLPSSSAHYKYFCPNSGPASASLGSASLASASLGSASLASASHASASHANANLASASLASASLANANLASASLANANLASASLANANLANASLANASLPSASLPSASLANASLANASLANVSLANASLASASLANASLASASIASASLASGKRKQEEERDRNINDGRESLMDFLLHSPDLESSCNPESLAPERRKNVFFY